MEHPDEVEKAINHGKAWTEIDKSWLYGHFAEKAKDSTIVDFKDFNPERVRYWCTVLGRTPYAIECKWVEWKKLHCPYDNKAFIDAVGKDKLDDLLYAYSASEQTIKKIKGKKMNKAFENVNLVYGQRVDKMTEAELVAQISAISDELESLSAELGDVGQKYLQAREKMYNEAINVLAEELDSRV